MVAVQVDAKRWVFVDEMGTNTSLSPLYAWAPKGRRAYCSVPRNRGPNATVLSSMSAEGMGPSLTVEGATTSVVFEAYVEQVLAPAPRKGQVVVMDNLWTHKGEGINGTIEQRGCQLVYLPAYSPDLNPSRKRSRRSRDSCGRPKPGLERRWSRRSVRRYLRSPPGTLVLSLSTAATGRRFDYCGERCRGDGQGARCCQRPRRKRFL